MGYYIETGVSSLNKYGEELCGDNVEMARTGDATIIVMSDGLGSGVKANILATLTAKIAVTMLQKGASLDEVVETVGKTLPVCKVRNLAYSTFTILQVFSNGKAYLAEFDNPSTFFIRNGKVTAFEKRVRMVGDREVREANLSLQEGDFLIAVSDGVIHAGIGGVLNLGWQWPNVAEYLERTVHPDADARDVSAWLIFVCEQLYGGKPGDDTTAVTVKLRRPRYCTIMAGPPADPARDRAVVAKLMESTGVRVVCGGTTGKLVARELGKHLEVELATGTASVPPTGHIEGIDLVTEGIITLSKALEIVSARPLVKELKNNDGATRLAKILLTSDILEFLVGKAINPAHQNPALPVDLALKTKVVCDLAVQLRAMGKSVVTRFY